jgi:hypothetical protein
MVTRGANEQPWEPIFQQQRLVCVQPAPQRRGKTNKQLVLLTHLQHQRRVRGLQRSVDPSQLHALSKEKLPCLPGQRLQKTAASLLCNARKQTL